MVSAYRASGAVAADARSVTDLTNTRFQLGENGGMFLISAPLNGNNWLTWSRSVRIALEGKDKLGFIDGSIEKPTEGTPEFKQWRITDSAAGNLALKYYTKLLHLILTLKPLDVYVFATNVTPHKAKFDPRAFKCVFIGYVHGQKAYKLYDLENKITVISRDVVFHEAIFPFQNTSPTTENSFFPQSIPALDTILDDDVVHIHNAPNSTDTHPPDTSSIHDPPIPSALIIHPLLFPFADLTLPHKEFLAALSIIKEPRCYMQAKDCKEWVHAMQQEIQALEKNQTWDIVDLPTGKKAIGCKWVYKVKLNPDGSIERYKARLVAKGYNQVEGVDYIDSFSPVAKAVTVRTLLAVASGNRWPIHQVDINNAFLHGFLDEDIYMTAPDGYQISSGKVCKLKRSLYGLKQASRQWNFELTAKLISYGFTQSSHDYCLFFKDTAFLHFEFTIKDLGPAKYFLGLEIARSAAGTSVTQHKFIRDIIQDAGLVNAKPTLTPLPLGLKLSSHNSPVLTDSEPFRRLIGRLLYLNFTRPDISYGTQQLNQFVHKPCLVHMDAAFHLIRYLKGCPDRGLFFPSSSSFVVRAYCDADWASCVDSRRSLTGYCVFLGDALISWKIKKQPTVARSTAEAEYRSLGLLFVSCVGSHTCYRICVFQFLFLFLFTATTRRPCILWRILCSTSAQTSGDRLSSRS
ncbi:UNVERIFIED_CONTAM: Retrovirus-related Pol polyprotein from transposon RE1 [Sesamum latifolium]|uniref:Retrovirus-related Pol polyprotein from transposon RE1 n=1 Tax=Sesamum latifolium TaxID=2727402 RepID=A0AAW2Y2Q9_9LAMI